MYKALLYDLSGRSLVAVKTLKGKQHLLVRLSDINGLCRNVQLQ